MPHKHILIQIRKSSFVKVVNPQKHAPYPDHGIIPLAGRLLLTIDCLAQVLAALNLKPTRGILAEKPPAPYFMNEECNMSSRKS
jgi:hypothetical protein